jgi:hypothetical protein
LPPLSDLKKEILDQLLDPENGLDRAVADQLRTRLNLPAGPPSTVPSPQQPASGPSTNAPAAGTK